MASRPDWMRRARIRGAPGNEKASVSPKRISPNGLHGNSIRYLLIHFSNSCAQLFTSEHGHTTIARFTVGRPWLGGVMAW